MIVSHKAGLIAADTLAKYCEERNNGTIAMKCDKDCIFLIEKQDKKACTMALFLGFFDSDLKKMAEKDVQGKIKRLENVECRESKEVRKC